MRKISANYIYPVSSKPLKNGIIVLDDDNKIQDLIDTNGKVKEIQDLEFYNGILIPGFIDGFGLLSWPTFSKEDFLSFFQIDFLSNLEKQLREHRPDAFSIQRGINHMEAFGTKGAADFFPTEEGVQIKQNSKVLFRNVNSEDNYIDYQVGNYTALDQTPILINRHTLACFPVLDLQMQNQFCIGTGSLGMYQKLSVLEELKYIQQQFPELQIWELIKWASIHTARYLGLEENLGSLEMSKTPGLNLLSNIDFKDFKFTEKTSLKVII